MFRLTMIVVLFMLSISSCSKQDANPLLKEFETPFGIAPFDQIEPHHFMPAFREGIRIHEEEIAAIASSPEPPTFENTIVALERSGEQLTRVRYLFSNLNGALTSREMQDIAGESTPLLSKHDDAILMNPGLFERIRAVYEGRDALDLDTEQQTLLEKYYKDFVRSGAALAEKEKEELRKINEELALLSLKFGENILEETNRFELVIENESDLSGLPESVIRSAAEAASEREHDGTWVFTLHKPSLIPFLTYSDKRDLREKMFTAYINQGNNGNDLDNKERIKRMVELRLKRARLLGYETHAHYVLEHNMAAEPKAVYTFLQELWEPALENARREARELQAMVEKEGNEFKLRPWDWWYYAEKLKQEKYALDDNLLRPYFQMENVRRGAFDVASRLFGVSFEPLPDLPVYHPDVSAFEVRGEDGSHIGILLTDYFPRSSKRGGAWMSSLRKQSRINGNHVSPIIYNVGNFTKPSGDKPALLSLDEVETLFHEFGHALHGLLSDRRYPRLTGTSVARDFVELPSQIMENWATEPEVLKQYALHYQTGEPIPDELIERISKASLFNQGFETVELLSASFLDMDWHTLTDTDNIDVLTFEKESLDRIGLIPEIVVRYRSTYFRHIFAGGYSSGYYSYLWAEALDADAFNAFRENGLFDQHTAKSFRENILAAGGTEDPMVLYKRFRGSEPDNGALLMRRGLN